MKPSIAYWLTGDVGATNSRLRLARANASGPREDVIKEEKCKNADHESLEQMLRCFLGLCNNDHRVSTVEIEVCLGIAATVKDGEGQIVLTRSRRTGRPWPIVSEIAAAKALSVGKMSLLNDLIVGGLGVIGEREAGRLTVTTLQEPERRSRRDKTVGVVGFGTGMGQAFFSQRMGERIRWHESEHGRSACPVLCIEDFDVVEFLRQDIKRDIVDTQSLASGPGISNLFRYYCEKYEIDVGKFGDLDAKSIAKWARLDEGRNDHSTAARKAMQKFVDVCAVASSNFALAALLDELYIIGDIARSNCDFFEEGLRFQKSFTRQDWEARHLHQVEVNIVTNEDIGVDGAWHYLSDTER
jgi:glucokinase